jgi:hypothetical protein
MISRKTHTAFPTKTTFLFWFFFACLRVPKRKKPFFFACAQFKCFLFFNFALLRESLLFFPTLDILEKKPKKVLCQQKPSIFWANEL